MAKDTTFNDLQTYIKLHDGIGKPMLDFEQMYKLFKDFTFTASKEFGQYDNFGKAFERKNYCMEATSEKSNKTCYIVFYRYTDTNNENLAYSDVTA